MATLKNNYVLPIAATVFFSLTAWAVWAVSAVPTAFVAESERNAKAPAVFGVDGDNTADTLRSVEAIVQQQREDQERLEARNRELSAKIEDMLSAKDASDQQMAAAVQRAVATEQAGAENKTSQLEKSITQLGTLMAGLQNRVAEQGRDARANRTQPETEVVPRFGLEGMLGMESSGSVIDGERLIDAVWIQPLDRPVINSEDGSSTGVVPRARTGIGTGGTASTNAFPQVSTVARASATKQKTAFYTIPDLSALTGGVSATSLVGKIYTDEIKDPWPFKISIGRENFGANTVDLPSEIEGMLFEGYAVGDWTMSCVRGTLIAASFIFEDGTIVKAYGTDLGSRPKEAQVVEDSIGYIADPYGNPCISGEKHTSAPSYLAARMLAAGVEGYGTALGDAEITRQANTGVNGTTITELVTGGVDRYAGANALEAGAKETSAWLRARQAQVFDLIYAPSGSRVDVHLQQEIYIDKKPNARKIRYNQGGSRHANLD